MSSNKEYHDFLRFLYFEGYADSYEEAEELVESLSDDEIEYLYEARRKRKLAHSFPLTKTERKYVENIGRRLEGEIVPPGGSARKRSARKPEPEPEPSPTRSASKKRITFDDRSQASDQGNTRRTRSLNAEFDLVADYLFSEGYADSLDGAEVMAENISASWVNEILDEKTIKATGEVADRRARTTDPTVRPSRLKPMPEVIKYTESGFDKKASRRSPGARRRKDERRQGVGGFVA